MRIDDVKLNDIVYHTASGKRVTVIGIDVLREYVLIRDNEKNVKEVHVSRLEPITNDDDWSAEDILRREG